MERALAIERLVRLHRAQTHFHEGGSVEPLRSLLATDIRWTVPGDNAIAGVYEGIDAVLEYFARRREIASGTFKIRPTEVLTGVGDHVAALTDGTATIDGAAREWSTVGLYQLRGDRVAACWLLPLDLDVFDRIWQAPARTSDGPF